MIKRFKRILLELKGLVKHVERAHKIDVLLKEKLLEYGKGVGGKFGIQDIDAQIQIVEMLEDLNFIELAYKLAKKIQVNLAPESAQIAQVRELVRRLHVAPITEQKDVI